MPAWLCSRGRLCDDAKLGSVSLYRTWRPRTFTELVGQDAVVRTLSTALETGRLAHAYLFSGPRGSGKTSAAKILARCFNCVAGPTATPDNTCEFCRAILEGTALDVLEIDAASNRGIDEIRALRDAVKFAPSTMRKKVYILDEAHMLTGPGANAFLKTLEEPPEHAVFILCTTAPESLPATILSRCQRYAFRRIGVPTMIARMREIAAAEAIEIDDAALGALAYRAEGGLRDALTMLEQVAAFGGGRVDAAAVEAAFGATGHAMAQALVAAVLAEDPVESLRLVERASDDGLEMQTLLRGAIAELRHLLVGRIDPDLLERDLSLDDARRTAETAQATPQAKLVRALRLFMDALASSGVSGNARLELETAVLRAILIGEDPAVEALADRVALLEGGSARPAPAKPRAPREAPPAREEQPPREAPPPANGGLTLERLRHHWPAVLDRVRAKQRPSVAGHLARATLISFDGETLTIAVPDQMTLKMLNDALDLVGPELATTTEANLKMRTVMAVTEAGDPPETGAADLLDYAVK
ncbi:MAG: DNA polymerase III subunit gamma/tau, partial [Candidatus Eremiobacteraeota bacterium]|nr:DNA polymerase III subunit gamma/tau [Candidatus Eremiobacteraeota bacterium]